MAVGHERGDVVVRLGSRLRGAGCGEQRGQREEIACSVGAVRNQSEDLGDEALLDASFLQVRLLVLGSIDYARRGSGFLGRIVSR